MRWLVVGSNGQLGTDLLNILADRDDESVGVDLPRIDITERDSIAAVLADVRPDVVINVAAFTAVDAAENDEETAHAINGMGAGLVAEEVARSSDARLLHISTDYVFDGNAEDPYPEGTDPNPQSAYGRTKLAGEELVCSALPDRHYIIRTAWLYGEHGQNFVKTMIRLAGERDTVSVVTDQVGQPTWSHDLAEHLIALAAAPAPAGIYHGTNSGQCSWYEFTREIFSLIGADPDRVLATDSSAFSRPAPRPPFSVLGHDGWQRAGLAPMRSWREAAAEAVPRIAKQSTPD